MGSPQLRRMTYLTHILNNIALLETHIFDKRKFYFYLIKIYYTITPQCLKSNETLTICFKCCLQKRKRKNHHKLSDEDCLFRISPTDPNNNEKTQYCIIDIDCNCLIGHAVLFGCSSDTQLCESHTPLPLRNTESLLWKKKK